MIRPGSSTEKKLLGKACREAAKVSTFFRKKCMTRSKTMGTGSMVGCELRVERDCWCGFFARIDSGPNWSGAE